MKTTALISSIVASSIAFVSAGPNLTPDVRNFAIELGYVGEDTEVQDGCIPNGTHNLLRFDFVSKNIGDADFIGGEPMERPDLFYYHLSHHHFHMREFNQYRLIGDGGNIVIPSTKPGFCLCDAEQELPTAGPEKFSISCLSTEVMGISAGWADVYTADIPCQYLVIDDIPAGDYILVAVTNAARKVPEDTYDDNTVSRGLHIEGSTVYEIPLPTSSISARQSVSTTSVQGAPTGEAAMVSVTPAPTQLASAAARPCFAREFATATFLVLASILFFV